MEAYIKDKSDNLKNNRTQEGRSPERVLSRKEVSQRDKVEVSRGTAKLQRLRELVDATPEIRIEKVESLKKAIKEGNYNVRGEQVADSILKNALKDSKT